MRDCVFLVADGTMATVFGSFLTRHDYHDRLGCRALNDFEAARDILVHPRRDPGVYADAHEFLRDYRRLYQRAVLALDAAWEGSPGVENIEQNISEQMRRTGWEAEAFAVIVIDPELENWIWQRKPYVAEVLRYRGDPPLWDWLDRSGHWPKEQPKPADPKGTVEHVLQYTRTPRSAALYRKIIARASVVGCADLSFKKLRQALGRWFPAEGA